MFKHQQSLSWFSKTVATFILVSLLSVQSFAGHWNSADDVQRDLDQFNEQAKLILEKYQESKSAPSDLKIIAASTFVGAIMPSTFIGLYAFEHAPVKGNDVQQMGGAFVFAFLAGVASSPLGVVTGIGGAIKGVVDVVVKHYHELTNTSSKQTSTAVTNLIKHDFITPEEVNLFHQAIRDRLQTLSTQIDKRNWEESSEEKLRVEELMPSEFYSKAATDTMQGILDMPFMNFLSAKLFKTYCDHFKISGPEQSLERVQLLGMIYFIAKNHDLSKPQLIKNKTKVKLFNSLFGV